MDYSTTKLPVVQSVLDEGVVSVAHRDDFSPAAFTKLFQHNGGKV